MIDFITQSAQRFRVHAYIALGAYLTVLIAMSQYHQLLELPWVWRFMGFVAVLLGVFVVSTTKLRCVIALILGLSHMISGIFAELDIDSHVTNVLDFFNPVLFLYLIYCVFHHVYSGKSMDKAQFVAGVTGYLILIWIFAGLYGLTLDHNPEAFRLVNAPGDVFEITAKSVYCSVVTQTTVGYGDITPVSATARALVMVQSIVSVLYLAVTVARLVGSTLAKDQVE